MKLDRRFTNGLAWAGVLLVIGVPTADLLSAQFSGDASRPAGQVAVVAPAAPTPAPLSQRPDAPAAKPAAQVAATTPAKPVAPAATQTASAVDNFLQSGKPLPSYITGGGAAPAKPAQVAVTPPPAATAPAAAPTNVATTTPPARTPIVTTPAAVDPVQVASIPKVAPVPMPLSMRPASRQVPVTVAAPITDIYVPPIVAAPVPPTMVTSADLDDWETGPLSEFLAKKNGQRGSSATVTSDYDPDGFYLDQGPNRTGRDRIVGWEEQPFLFFPD